ncbi:adenylate kinase [Rhizobiales bacterium]|uniref:adenylate kinase n=1 Tax=Ensifer sp. 22460 TaxID=3453922 RepID=UPI000DDDF626
MKLILLGPPGAGKGTQANCISQRFGIPHLSTGDMLRAEIRAGTSFGAKLRSTLGAGALLDDETISEIVALRLRQPDVAAGFILDGYPRTLVQADALDDMLVGDPISAVIELVVNEDILYDRIRARATQAIDAGAEVRSDDNAETLQARLSAYYQATHPLSQHYAERGVLKQIDGLASIDDVTQEIANLLTGVEKTDTRQSVYTHERDSL